MPMISRVYPEKREPTIKVARSEATNDVENIPENDDTAVMLEHDQRA
jgi:hypothetical protein